MNALLAGIPQSGSVLGSPSAPVTLQYFGDLECPICREFTLGSLEALIKRFVRAGSLRIQYRSLQSATRNRGVFLEQQEAALAAGPQHRMWNFLETFYREQGEEGSGYVTSRFLSRIAGQVPGMKLGRWRAAISAPRYRRAVLSDERLADVERFTGTPSFLLGPTGGDKDALPGLTARQLQDASALLEPAIEQLLAAG